MRIYVLKFLKWMLITGIIIGILAIFNFNPVPLVQWLFDWIVWIVKSIADIISGNDTTRSLLTTRPQ